MLSKKNEIKIISLAGCFLSDMTLIAWIYYQATNYQNFNVIAKSAINSPDFQIQLYKVILQSLTFLLLLFILAQSAVYIMAIKKMRAAYLYLKIFAVVGFALALLISISHSLYALLPALFYLLGYYTFAKIFKETAVSPQNLPQ
ncbi:MAG: hypothetical protein HOP07_07200 [Bacteriovoracaceae bacterium]|nr:hypothetical protein [Bacteriovoracaceae bacterium]